jgi:hypothetical protein
MTPKPGSAILLAATSVSSLYVLRGLKIPAVDRDGEATSETYR